MILLRIFFRSWRMAIRTTRRFIVFLVAYAILLTWIALIIRQYYIELFAAIPVNFGAYLVIIGWTMIAGAIMGIVFSWLIAHSRRDDIATLKCIGWSNQDVRQLVLGEIIFITISSLTVIALLAVLVSGLYFAIAVVWSLQPLGNTVVGVHPALNYIIIKPEFTLAAFLIVMAVQIPGILILIWRSLRISPMRALTRPE